jgi:excisionase family DNA binding protein
MNPPTLADALDLLTPEQLAEKFKLPVRTIRYHAQTGELPAFRVGRQWRFRASDLERHLNRRRNDGVQR